MNDTFRVHWQGLFKSLSIFMTAAITVPILLLMGFRFVALGFDFGKTFEHMSPIAFLLILLCVPAVSAALAFLISQWYRLGTITVANGNIQGRTYWGMKNKIPMSDITKLTSFSNNGINSIVVYSRYHGNIHISDHTERLNDLLEILESRLSQNARTSVSPRPDMMQQEPLPLGSKILLLLLAVGVLMMWISYFRFQPDEARDFATVTGTLVTAKEHIVKGSYGNPRSGYLDIRLQGSPVTYRIPADGYLDYFRREAFFSEVPMGATIQLTVRATTISAPETFILNTDPTIFVRGVRVDGQDYCTIQDHIAWQKSNNRMMLGLAIAATGFQALVLFGLLRRQKLASSRFAHLETVSHS